MVHILPVLENLKLVEMDWDHILSREKRKKGCYKVEKLQITACVVSQLNETNINLLYKDEDLLLWKKYW